MTYYQFVHAVEEKVKEESKGQLDVSIHAVLKNNGRMRQGILLKERNINISPTIYLEEYYNRSLRGDSLEEIAKEILRLYGNVRFDAPMDADFICDFDKIQEKIVYRIINREKNLKLLEDVPYKEYLDFAIVYYLVFEATSYGMASMMINDTHMSMWRTDLDDIHKKAKENTRKLFPYQFSTMAEAVSEMMGKPTEIENDMLYILTNESKSFGATTMLYPGCLEDIGDELKENYYMIPSSVHELILIKETNAPDEKELVNLVKEVNETQVADEEVLSNHIYYYDRTDNRLQIAL